MSDNSGVRSAIQGCVDVLERSELLLDSIPQSLYVLRDEPHDSIGGHLRHGLEHITCFLDGVSGGLIDYDQRRREAILETDVAKMREAITETKAGLLGIDAESLDTRIVVMQIPGFGVAPVEVESSVVRELIFLSSHMIHHLSVIYIHCGYAGVELPRDFPLAFSTSAYRNITVG